MNKKILSTLPPDDKVILIRKYESVYQGEEIENKKSILIFLNSFHLCCATTASVFDNVKNEEVKNSRDCGYCNGVFYWDETDIYHFEKYNMPLKDEFIKFVSDNSQEK